MAGRVCGLFSGQPRPVAKHVSLLCSAALLICCTLVRTSSALGNGHAETPLLGHTWKDCHAEHLQSRASMLKDKLPAYTVLIVGLDCLPPPVKSAAPHGVRVGVKLGENCDAIQNLTPNVVDTFRISYVEVGKKCLQQDDKGHLSFSRKQQAKLKHMEVCLCSMPQMDLPWLWGSRVANSWQVPVDSSSAAEGSWEHTLQYLDNSVAMAQFAGPGAWNFLGPLQVGSWSGKPSPAARAAMDRSQFALWALLKSPLVVGADVERLPPASLAVLNNSRLIAINQDPLGVAGALIWKLGSLELYAVPLKRGRRAVVCFNRADALSAGCRVRWTQLGYPAGMAVTAEDLFNGSTSVAAGELSTGPVGGRDVVAMRLQPNVKHEVEAVPFDMWRPWEHNSAMFSTQCRNPAAVTGGITLMTLALVALVVAGLTIYLSSLPAGKGLPLLKPRSSANVKSDEDA